MKSTDTTTQPKQAANTPTPTRYQSALKIRVDTDVKAALTYVLGTANDEDVKFLLMKPNGIEDLADSVIKRNYTEVFTPGSKLMHVSLSVGEYRDWYRSYPNPHWCAQAMEAMAEATPEMRATFKHGASRELMPVEGADLTHDLKEEVKCYQLTGLSETDSQQLVGEIFNFCNRFTVPDNLDFDVVFRKQLLGGLMDEFCKHMEKMRAADQITRYALAKQIMGDYMVMKAKEIAKHFQMLGLQLN